MEEAGFVSKNMCFLGMPGAKEEMFMFETVTDFEEATVYLKNEALL